MKLLPLLGFVGMAAIMTPCVVYAQNVTWGATGLPPGMSIVTLNGTTANVTGTPTVAGNYNAVIFPKIGNEIGDMVSFPLTVLPSGMDLPTYYSYSRTAPGELWMYARGGGNGAILLSGQKKIYLTTNGTNFTEASFQSAAPNGYAEKAEFAGSRCLVKFGNPSALYYSDNRTVFKPLAFPSDLTNPDYSVLLVSNRTNRFFLISPDSNSGAKIWSIQSNQTTWKAGSLPITDGIYNASMAANGSLLVIACSNGNDSIGLCYSTNSGDTWIKTTANPGITKVAYGNGIFLGSGSSGFWKSTNGIDWQKVSSQVCYSGLLFSTPENLFFSDLGVSKDGLYWVGYGEGYFGSYGGDRLVSSGTGLVFCDNQQLTLTKIPRFWDNSSRKATVNKPTSFQIRVSQ